MQLKPYYEIVGTPIKVRHIDNCDVVTISAKWKLKLPKNAAVSKEIEKLIGKRIGIFNNDGEYKVRVADEENKKELKK